MRGPNGDVYDLTRVVGGRGWPRGGDRGTGRARGPGLGQGRGGAPRTDFLRDLLIH